MSFEDAIDTAVEEARKAADEAEGGDPGTMVSAEVDGRTSFVSKFKDEATDTGNGWELNGVKLTDDYGLTLPVPSGTDAQLHSKKIAALRAFADEMENQGWSCGLDINTYAY